MQARSTPTLATLSTALLVLGACGGGNGGDTGSTPAFAAATASLSETPDITRVLQLDLETYQFGDGLDWQELEGKVSSFAEPLSEAELLTEVNGSPFKGFDSEDDCRTFDQAQILAYEEEGDGSIDVRDGEIVTLAGTSGSLGELHLTVRNGDGGYSSDYLADGRLSGPLSLSVSGGTAPSFVDVELPRIASFDTFAVVDANGASSNHLHAGAKANWNAPEDATMLVQVTAIDVVESDGDDELRAVLCVGRDDGSFEFPPETRAWMGPEFKSAYGWSVARVGWRIEREGDTALLLTRTVIGDADTLN